MTIASQQPVCVTGASGFIAAHIVQQLLQAGYRVRGTVRSLKNPDKYRYLTALPGAQERLELIAAELLTEGSYDTATKGCEYVMHTASPYAISVQDPQRDLVDPAVKGTRNVLASCRRSPSVKRVVLTSSMAAVTDEPDPNHTLTEADWNEKSSLTRNPYYYSKTLAEKEGWNFVNNQKPAFDLVVINPFLVVGPSLGPSLNTSNAIMRDLLTGVYPGIMNLSWGFVDVRDVARAHILAMETPRASGLYVCAAETVSMKDTVETMRTLGYGHYKLPGLNLAHKVGDILVTLASYTQAKGTGTYLRTHIGRAPYFDSSKIKQDLGLSFMPVPQSVKDTLEDLLHWKHLEAK